MPRTISRAVRDAALNLLHHRGSLLAVTRVLRDAPVPAPVIGGIAVVLHEYARSTTDIDVLVDPPLEAIADLLNAASFPRDSLRREFVRGDIPVHLMTCDPVAQVPKEVVEIDGNTTVGLADPINMKIASGSTNMLRAIDLADVIGLIRENHLTRGFAERLDRSVRPISRKLVKAIEQERRALERSSALSVSFVNHELSGQRCGSPPW